MSLLDRLLTVLGLGFEFDLDAGGQPFDIITPTLTLGSRPRPEQRSLLQELGITHVVSCLDASKRPLVEFLREDFDTLFLPLRDEMGQDVMATFPTFCEFVASAEKGKVLVHCQAGVSRSATLTIAAVMQSQRLRFYEAYHAVRSRRPQILPNIGFASQLQRFEHTLFPEAREGHASLTRYLHEVCKVPAEIEVLHEMVQSHDYDAMSAIRAIFGDDVPRVIQGVRA